MVFLANLTKVTDPPLLNCTKLYFFFQLLPAALWAGDGFVPLKRTKRKKRISSQLLDDIDDDNDKYSKNSYRIHIKVSSRNSEKEQESAEAISRLKMILSRY